MFNLFTQLALMAVVVVSLPLILHGLSTQDFGLLSLIWGVIGYFSLLDFGLSRANTKFLADATMSDDKLRIRKLVWTSISVTALAGIFFGIILAFATPFFIREVFKITGTSSYEAQSAMLASAAGLPFMLLFGNIKGFQMALQRFDIVNLLQGILGVVQWAGAVILVKCGFGVAEIIYMTVGSRILITIAAFIIFRQLIPHIFESIHLWDRGVMKELIKFGGWLSVSNIISPLFLYLDRFLIGMLFSLTAVASYAMPQEAVSRFLFIPLSLTATLFPALSERAGSGPEGGETGAVYEKSVKYLFILLLPMVVIFIANAREILAVWLGAGFVSESVTVFQILLVGFLFNALAQIPATALHAYNRPDLTAKFHIIELPVLIILNLLLIPLFGVAGAAAAWTIRILSDTSLLFQAVNRLSIGSSGFRKLFLIQGRMPLHIIASVFPLIMIFPVFDGASRMIVTVAFVPAYSLIAWYYCFDEYERQTMIQSRKKIFIRHD